MAKKNSAKSETKKDSAKKSNDKGFLVVGIGASAGGIKALKELFGEIPAEPGMAFVVILHLSQQFESNLAEIIQRETAMSVEQVTETVEVEPNKVYVIPPAKHLEMYDGVIRVKEPERIKGKRVPIDYFFRSLADAYGRRAVSIILSGTGTDGTLGMKHIKGKDGFAIVQDPDDAEYDGMPRSAIETKIADVVMPVSEMPEKLLFVRDSTEKFRLTDGGDGEVAKEIKNLELLRDVLTLLRVRTGHDFSNYKRPTLIRRVARHLQIHETDDLKEYLEILRDKPDEVLSLLKNLLINVTNFFRDKEAFNALEKKIIPAIFDRKTSEDQVRIWIAGCSSGEEAYSIAILLQEYAATLPDPPKIQIFASDVDEEAVAEAREGRFTEAVVTDVSPERLRQFFIKEDDTYRIRKSVREMILFAPHNILRDPPFSRLDLISCRNVLIYLNRETQEKILQVFNFALKDSGYLFLGASESADSSVNFFSPVDKKHKIYQCRPSNANWNAPPQLPVAGVWTPRIHELPTETRRNLQSFGELHHRLLEQYAPPSVLVNEEGDILHLSENAGRFLRFVGGKPTANLLKVIHPALLSDVRAALFAARQENKSVEAKNIRVKFNGDEKNVNLTVRPVKLPEAAALVIFEETESEPEVKKTAQAISAGDQAMESVVRRMETDLERTKDQLRNTIEQYETSVEELKASNEELQAMNEELRSATEELETGKEELQSVNEELTTVNVELKEKIEEVSHSNSDLQNLMQATDIATIFLDRALQVKRYTPKATEIFNLIPSDIGRPLEHITHRLAPDDFHSDAEEALKNLRVSEREVYSKDQSFFLARFSPYRTVEDKIDGVVLSFIDITKRKKAENALRASEEKFRAFVNATSDTVYIMGADWREMRYLEGKKFIPTTKKPREDWTEEYIPETDKPAVWAAIEKAIETKSVFELEHRVIRLDGTIGWTFSRAVPILSETGGIIEWLGTASDITERKRAEEELQNYKSQLEKKVEERTAELAQANRDLKAENEQRRLVEKERVALLEQLVTTQEDERRRIARDMHDHFGQHLTALRLNLETLRKICGDNEKICEQVDETQAIAKTLDSDISFFIWELRPNVLDDLGFKNAVESFVQKWSVHFSIPAEVHTGAFEEKRVSDDAEINLYRILQEALNNVYKHAKAKNVSVLLEQRDRSVVLIIEDDGRGFESEKTLNRRKGLGLIGMRERAALVGGNLQIESSKGKGTTIFVRVPFIQKGK